ncbi:hypothetical protein [Streptomyces sp. NPDC007088]|uniref:hypothetical protein n=1 Tax=Streptomyces sp. NPDC007088 TaxID=3364773 RepID=UPI003684A585
MTRFPLARMPKIACVSALCLGLFAGAAGCGEDPDAGTNGVGKLPAGQIHTKARSAADTAHTVRLKGSVISGGHTYTLDMRLAPNGGLGKVTSKGSTFELLRVEDHLYLRAGTSFWQHQSPGGTTRDGKEGDAGKGASGGDEESAASAAGKLDGKYVKVPKKDPSYAMLSLFTDKKDLLDGLLTLHGRLVAGDRGTSAGVRTVKVSGDKGGGGSLDVSLEGQPYPLLLRRAGDAGTIRLSEWNKDFALKEPGLDETVDYGDRLPTA